MSNDKVFGQGIWVKEPREQAPAFVFGSISVNLDKFMEFAGQYVNEKGFVNMDILRAKDAEKGLYCQLNTYVKPTEEVVQQSSGQQSFDSSENIPF